jgi:beta-mannosidase
VASWSSLEYDGSWKLLHHEARRFYEALHLALIHTGDRAEAYAFNDNLEVLPASLILRFRQFDGTIVREMAVESVIKAASSTLLWSMPIEDLPGKAHELYLDAALRAVPGSDNSGNPAFERRSRLFFAEPKRCELADPRLKVSVESGKDGLAVRIRAEAPAFWVALGLKEGEVCPTGRFADSGFDLGPGEEVLVPFLQTQGTPVPSPAKLEAAMRILHLRASYLAD